MYHSITPSLQTSSIWLWVFLRQRALVDSEGHERATIVLHVRCFFFLLKYRKNSGLLRLNTMTILQHKNNSLKLQFKGFCGFVT